MLGNRRLGQYFSKLSAYYSQLGGINEKEREMDELNSGSIAPEFLEVTLFITLVCCDAL